MDRLIQQCFLQVLEPICQAKFHDRSFGFRPNRSQENAVAVTYSLAQRQGLHFVVDLDIKGFFDNVSHGKLLRQMWALGIRDKKLLSIISSMLKSEVAGIGFPEKVVFLKRGKPRQRFQLGFGETVCFHREIPPLADFVTPYYSRPDGKCKGFLSLPAGRDAHKAQCTPGGVSFLPTPSVWRATFVAKVFGVSVHHFYPRPPRGGRR